jgi:hypothetical protein
MMFLATRSLWPCRRARAPSPMRPISSVEGSLPRSTCTVPEFGCGDFIAIIDRMTQERVLRESIKIVLSGVEEDLVVVISFFF